MTTTEPMKDTRADKITALHAAVANENYQVKAEQIADKIPRKYLSLIGTNAILPSDIDHDDE